MNISQKKYIGFMVVIVFFVSLSLHVSTTEAVARAIFPDASRLQPPPANTHANISQNIQSSGTVAPDITVQPTEPAPITPTSAPEATSHTSLVWWIAGILILGAIIGYTARNKNKK